MDDVLPTSSSASCGSPDLTGSSRHSSGGESFSSGLLAGLASVFGFQLAACSKPSQSVAEFFEEVYFTPPKGSKETSLQFVSDKAKHLLNITLGDLDVEQKAKIAYMILRDFGVFFGDDNNKVARMATIKQTTTTKWQEWQP
jgi:hypothetical protein